jgi:hypothetical protein
MTPFLEQKKWSNSFFSHSCTRHERNDMKREKKRNKIKNDARWEIPLVLLLLLCMITS